MNSHYDLIVIGSGPAGEKAAAKAAYFGKRVAVIERAPHLGGASLHTGTIPSKTLRETALYFSGLKQRGLYGIDYSLRGHMTVRDLTYRKEMVVQREWELVEQNLARHRVAVVHGDATFIDPHTVEVRHTDRTVLTGEVILIATGSRPFHPPHLPSDGVRVLDSDSLFTLSKIPSRMIVVGGGAIGTEYASLFTALEVQVTLIEPRDRILSFMDSEITARLERHLVALGLEVIPGTRVERIDILPDSVHAVLPQGRTIEADVALVAAGRKSNIEGLGLERIKVNVTEKGTIAVNEWFQTSVPHIYAAGDVVGFPALAATSMEQGRCAVVHAFHLAPREGRPVLPIAVYAVPEVACVGLTEDQCREGGERYAVGRATYDQNARGQIIGDLTGMVKLIFAPSDLKLLGVHILGESASELIHLGAHVLNEGGTIETFVRTVFNYPTLSELYKYAAYDGLGKVEPMKAPPSDTL